MFVCINAIKQCMHQRHDWELQTRVQSPIPAKFFSWDFSRFKYLGRFQLDCFNGKKWFDGHIQIRIAAVGQSPSGLWYTCVHAKQLLIDPMYKWVEKITKYSLFLRQWKVYQPAQSQRKKGEKKKKTTMILEQPLSTFWYSRTSKPKNAPKLNSL